jgi:hypothetical protein
MANDLNITPANFTLNRNKMFLHDPAVYIKFLDDTVDTSFHALGYMEMEKTWAQKLEYAVFKAGIPGQTIRKDAVNQEFTLDGQLKQISPDTLALLSNRMIQSHTGYKRVVIGSKIPATMFVSIELVTQTVDGKEVRLRIRYAQITSEDFSLALGGNEHAKIPFKIEALKDDDPLLHNPTWDYIGKGEVTGDLTSASDSVAGVVFGTIDNIKVGGRIFGPAGIPSGTTVDSVTYSGAPAIEMSAAATATAEDQTIYVELDEDDAEYDNIAYWYFAD